MFVTGGNAEYCGLSLCMVHVFRCSALLGKCISRKGRIMQYIMALFGFGLWHLLGNGIGFSVLHLEL